MRTRLAALTTLAAAAGTILTLALAGAMPANAHDDDGGDKVCDALDSGKIDTHGDPQTVTVTAPAGQKIVSYCVKAGSINQGDGPVYVTLAEPVTTLVIPGSESVTGGSTRTFTVRVR